MAKQNTRRPRRKQGAPIALPIVGFPLDATLNAIRVDLGAPGTSGTPGGDQQINHYFGYPFFYHVRPSTSGPVGSVDIAIDEAGPSDATAQGPINSVSLTYTFMTAKPNPVPVTRTMTHRTPGGSFRGEHLHLSIEFSDDRSTGTLIIERERHEGDDAFARVGIMIVSKDFSGTGTARGHFVIVPVVQDTSGNFPTTAKIHWPGLGSFAGPVGGGEIP